MTDEKKPEPTGDEPITAKTIMVAALAGSDLPPLTDGTAAEWLHAFTDPETVRRLGLMFTAAATGDLSGARHWAHQAEDSYLRSQPGGKSPSHR